ncbi:RNase E specificity factor CsrD [Enterovibrio norvegicus]|uniref:RNase E specificity factor CsrD n=1 Tax=Enterovibrio norvegicus TaxID=188144 RepID=A0ABV4KXB6_9GAMM|nr:RNase E specificity factor CsrD [Enterovibrio norvegicus]OEF52775.1 RNase E specificity factor CsrD [Enterovibrio norvegicus]OEF57737.1 RNase E specificity factor CsrD [Enterovibrio norvegicus]
MRKVVGMKLTNRLVAFVTLIVVCAMFVLFIGGAVSFRKLGTDFLSHYLKQVVVQIDDAVANPIETENIGMWLPKLLKASDVVELEISSRTGLLYRYDQIQIAVRPVELVENRYELPNNPGFFVTVKAVPPYADFAYSIGPMFSLSLAVLFIVLSLAWGIRWLKMQLHGAELLEDRGRMILAGRAEEVQKGDEREWPVTASIALDQMIAELRDARQERSRFDTFIRTNTFLDKLTGAANRVMFDNRLQTLLQDKGAHGAVMIIRIGEWDALVQELGKSGADEWVKEVGNVLSNAVQRFPDAILARYYDTEFAILLVHQSGKEARLFANQLMKALERLTPPEVLEVENWAHMGMTFFTTGERRGRLMEEADMAKRSAVLQASNGWYAFKKDVVAEDARGSVRWRTLLTRVFENGGPDLYRQTVKDTLQNYLHTELLARIKDENGLVVKASRFMNGIDLIGFNSRLDRTVVTKALQQLRQGDGREILAINVCAESLRQRPFQKWLRDALLQTPRSVLNRLMFEVSEGPLVNHFDGVRPTLRMIRALGCPLVVDQAGRSVVSTHYVKDIQPKYIKLHRSLVRDIHLRPENQLYVRSMLGACEPTPTQVLAVGVESEHEWKILMQLGVQGGQGRWLGAELSGSPATRKRQRWRKQ